MDESSSKRTGEGVVVSVKGCSLALKDTANGGDQSARCCNRIGCSGRLKYSKGNQVRCRERTKSSITSSIGTEIIGNPSKTLSTPMTNGSKSFAETSRKNLMDLHAEPTEITSVEVGSSGVEPTTRSRRRFYQRETYGNVSKYGTRNLECYSTADTILSNSSSSDFKRSKGKDIAKKENQLWESSPFTKGKKSSGSLFDSREVRGGLAIRDSSTASVKSRSSSTTFTRKMDANRGS